MNNPDIVIDALTDKIKAVEIENDINREKAYCYFSFMQDKPQSLRLEFVKRVYLNAFDERSNGRDSRTFYVACETITPIMESAEDEHFFIAVRDYVARLQECVKQFDEVGKLCDTDHLFGYELGYDFGYSDTGDE